MSNTFPGREKIFSGPLSWATHAKNAGVSAVFPNVTTLGSWSKI